MNRPVHTFLAALALSVVPALPALAQRPLAADKPWPRVALQVVLDATTTIPTLGHTHGEYGDCIIDIRNAGDGSNRLFLLERQAAIWILQDGKLLPDPFLRLPSNITTMDGERGLLSVAFPPNFKTSQHFYVLYTDNQGPRPGNVTLARYQVDPKNPNHALPDSGQILFSIPHTKYPNHNGGQLVFGPDGYLYWGIGDGGAGYDPNNNGQNLNAYLGKLLRIDVEGKPDPGKTYRVPPDNPFVNTPNAKPEIWAFGLRNPWRFSFDPLNGDLYIGNVGQDKWEQIYYAPASSKGGENYGWSIYEGTHDTLDTKPPQKPGTSTPIVFPVAEFSHRRSGPDRFVSITGGYVYRGSQYPDWKGVYFFSDWGISQIWALRRDPNGQWERHQVDDNQSPAFHPATFGVDEKGNLYTAGFSDGKIYQLTEAPADE
jgi:glucose/arabinose dehydrogenase